MIRDSRRSRGGRARAGRVAAIVCAAATMLTGCDFDVYDLPLPGGADLGDAPYEVKVQFRDVLDLVPQSAVKVNDVTVGKVDDIELDGYSALVTLKLRDDVTLPDNALAELRQTSLLGEKFVSLRPPPSGSSGDLLSDGDLIPLDRTGRNPEVEEVLGALSLLLNGGGVAQLKTIASEFNKALEGREGDVRSVFRRLDEFMGQLDENKAEIVQAIESLNRLAISINRQRDTIELALDEMPAALASIDRQRDDLVKMLSALNELSAVGTQVIRQSKVATIDSLRSLDPVLTKLAEAGDSLPKAFQVFLTYPFVDEVVGRNPVQARNLHMGDYTNLSVQMDLDLGNLQRPDTPLDPVLTPIEDCLASGDPTSDACQDLGPRQVRNLCNEFPSNPICDALLGGGGGGDDPGEKLTVLERCIRSGDPTSRPCRRLNARQETRLCNREGDNPLFREFCREAAGDPGGDGDGGGDLLPIPLPGVGRAAVGPVFFGAPTPASEDDVRLARAAGYDPTLAVLLVQGMVQR